MAAPTPFSQMLHDWLAARGEGVMSVVFGVSDLDKHKFRLESQGIEPAACRKSG